MRARGVRVREEVRRWNGPSWHAGPRRQRKEGEEDGGLGWKGKERESFVVLFFKHKHHLSKLF